MKYLNKPHKTIKFYIESLLSASRTLDAFISMEATGCSEELRMAANRCMVEVDTLAFSGRTAAVV